MKEGKKGRIGKALMTMLLVVFTTAIMLTSCYSEVEATEDPTSSKFTVTFNSNGGSKVNSQTVQKGKTASKPTNPEKDGFNFDDWYSDEDLTEAYSFDTPVTKNITLYAKWNEGPVTPVTVEKHTHAWAFKDGVYVGGTITETDQGQVASSPTEVSIVCALDGCDEEKVITLQPTVGLFYTPDLDDPGSCYVAYSDGGSNYCSAQSIVIPSTYIDLNGTSYSVKIAEYGGGWSEKINSLVIPSCIKTVIGFGYCSALSFVLLSEGVETIGNDWSSGVGGLIQSIAIPDSVTNFNLSDCSLLTTVKLPSGITAIPANCFNGCKSLLHIENLEGANSIGSSAFSNCFLLTDINLQEVSEIGDNAFECCYSIQSVDFPKATKIGNYAFQKCYSIKSVNFPKVTEIGRYAFDDCSSIESVNFPEATKIEGYAFCECSSLNNICIPIATAIGSQAFQNTSISRIELPKAESIGKWAFYGCKNLTDVILAEGLEKISEAAFDKCTNLREITIPASVTKVMAVTSDLPWTQGLFADCDKLEKITLLGNDITSIKDFSGDSFTLTANLNYPGTVYYLPEWVDRQYGGSSLVPDTCQIVDSTGQLLATGHQPTP